MATTFKKGTVWTPEMKKDLLQKVVTNIGSLRISSIFELLRPDFSNLGVGTIMTTYYDMLKKEPEAVAEVLRELDANSIKYTNPYAISKQMKSKPIITAVVSDEQPAPVEKMPVEAVEGELDIFKDVGSIIDGLTKLGDNAAGSFLSGLAKLVRYATDPGSNPLLEELRSKVTGLQEEVTRLSNENTGLQSSLTDVNESNKKLHDENIKLREDLESVSFIVDNFLQLNTAQKIANLGKITNDLKVTVDGFGNVIKTEWTK